MKQQIKPKVIQFRAGAPDKICMWTSPDACYDLVKKDGVNLCDYTKLELRIDHNNVFYLCSDELDILHANKLPLSIQKRCILPKFKSGEVIPYYEFVPKDSNFYKRLNDRCLFYYPNYESYDPTTFESTWRQILEHKDKFVVKVAIGSGSRGVYVIDSEFKNTCGTREHFNQFTESMASVVVERARLNNCNILVQNLAYVDNRDLDKFDVDLMIRNGKLVAYKWSLPDNPSTNWDHGYFIRNEYTDKMINSMVKYLVEDYGITDCMIGFDGYTNYDDYCTIIEVNFRQQNCFFMFEAFGIDFIDMWFKPEIDWMSKIPFGKHHHVRYWRCELNSLSRGK